MTGLMVEQLRKSFETPDEVRTLPKARIEVVHLQGHTAMRAHFEPGWHWAEHIRPAVGTDQCEASHVGYVVSGRLATRFPDGREVISRAGDFVSFPAGHDGWVVGDEPVVFVDFVGGEGYGKRE